MKYKNENKLWGEEEVIGLLTLKNKGCSNSEIAKELGRSTGAIYNTWSDFNLFLKGKDFNSKSKKKAFKKGLAYFNDKNFQIVEELVTKHISHYDVLRKAEENLKLAITEFIEVEVKQRMAEKEMEFEHILQEKDRQLDELTKEQDANWLNVIRRKLN